MRQPSDPMLEEFRLIAEADLDRPGALDQLADAICDLFTDDCLLEDTSTTDVVRGRAALHEYASWKPLWEPPYAPDPAAVAAIKAHAAKVTVLVVMATWCPDSKREIPRYFATMDAAGISDAVLTMVGVDRSKKDTEGLTEQYAITRVPTFVFLRDGKEIGRFVEKTPAGTTFEAEIAKILGGQ